MNAVLPKLDEGTKDYGAKEPRRPADVKEQRRTVERLIALVKQTRPALADAARAEGYAI